jgi:sugar phosphate isomerase/epimerase
MTRPVFGINVHDLRTDPKRGMQQAARMGFRAVELRALDGDIDPANLSESGRRHLHRYVRDIGLQLAALDADFGAGGMADPAAVDACVQRTGQVLAMARELGVPIVTGSVGRLDDADPRREQIASALRSIAEQADRIGTIYAVCTSYTAPNQLRRLVDELACPAVRVCTDPGYLVMSGYDPVSATSTLAEHVVLSHARDGLAGTSQSAGREVPLGQGHVNWLAYLATLSAADYAGPQILRRTDAERPLEDLQAGRDTLESQLP